MSLRKKHSRASSTVTGLARRVHMSVHMAGDPRPASLPSTQPLMLPFSQVSRYNLGNKGEPRGGQECLFAQFMELACSALPLGPAGILSCGPMAGMATARSSPHSWSFPLPGGRQGHRGSEAQVSKGLADRPVHSAGLLPVSADLPAQSRGQHVAAC